MATNVFSPNFPSQSQFFTVPEWTSTITKYLKDQLNKLSDFYHQSFQRMSPDVELAQKQWHYTVRLTDWLYEVCASVYLHLDGC